MLPSRCQNTRFRTDHSRGLVRPRPPLQHLPAASWTFLFEADELLSSGASGRGLWTSSIGGTGKRLNHQAGWKECWSQNHADGVYAHFCMHEQ